MEIQETQSQKWYHLFKRKTYSTHFIPQIDGLRFLAIWVVVVDHLHGFIRTKIPFAYTKPDMDYAYLPIYQFFDSNGRKGVLLFFMISGFILGMPFAKHLWQGAKEVSLKSYFLRRLTRLEPPYIINMVACYFILILYTGHDFAASFPKTFSGLLPNLGASLVYLQNILMPKNMSINPVSWSLEIEVQFYLLVPLLVLIFRFPKIYRRFLLVFLVLFITALQEYYVLPVRTIYEFLQYFLMGFLLLDIYLSGFKLKMNPLITGLSGLLVFFPFFYIDSFKTPYFQVIFIPVLFGLGLLVITNDFWAKVFSWKFFTAIGGMCYSIYLWHGLIISAVANKTIFYNFSHSYPVVLFFQMAMVLPFILGGSAVFYLLIEKPCMDREWPSKLWNFFKSIFKKDLKPII